MRRAPIECALIARGVISGRKHGNAVHQRRQTSTTCRWRLRVYFLLADLPNPTEVRLSTRGKLEVTQIGSSAAFGCTPSAYSCLTVAFGEPTAMPISPRGAKKLPAIEARTTPKAAENHLGTFGATLTMSDTRLMRP